MLYVISDTHIPEKASQLPKKFIERIKEDDLILHAGDFTELRIYRFLKDLATIYAVHGNMDSPEIKNILPSKRIIQIEGFKIGLVHGSGSPAKLAEKVSKEFKERLDVVVFGHSHSPCSLKQENTLLFNPGSLCGNIFSQEKSYGVLNMDEGKIWGEVFYIS